MKVHPAVSGDVAGMSACLTELRALGKRTSPADPAFVTAHYIAHPPRIRCTVAEALAYYGAMGFRTYRMPEGRTCKMLTL